jgi:predicted ATPase
MALCALGHSVVGRGRLKEAAEYCEQALALYNPAEHVKLAVPFGLDARSYAAMNLGFIRWLMGYPDQATAMSQMAYRWAEEIKHPSTLGLGYIFHLSVLQCSGDREQLIAAADAGMELARRYGLAVTTLYCQMFRSWAVRDVEGLRNALAIPDSMGQELGKTYYNSMLVELEVDAGRYEAALALLDKLIPWGRATGETYFLPGLLRLKGLCLRARGEYEAAEADLREAMDMAHSQASKALELRAAVTLAELLRERGRGAEIPQFLASLVQWFTEGLNMPDIMRARALLKEFPG